MASAFLVSWHLVGSQDLSGVFNISPSSLCQAALLSGLRGSGIPLPSLNNPNIFFVLEVSKKQVGHVEGESAVSRLDPVISLPMELGAPWWYGVHLGGVLGCSAAIRCGNSAPRANRHPHAQPLANFGRILGVVFESHGTDFVGAPALTHTTGQSLSSPPNAGHCGTANPQWLCAVSRLIWKFVELPAPAFLEFQHSLSVARLKTADIRLSVAQFHESQT